jgi:hypothetical protein
MEQLIVTLKFLTHTITGVAFIVVIAAFAVFGIRKHYARLRK